MGATRAVAITRHPGRETSWIPTADGRSISRDVGYAIVHAGGTQTIDEVAFAEPGDLILLGARSLEGMNLRVDSRNKALVAGGPIDAALSLSGVAVMRACAPHLLP